MSQTSLKGPLLVLAGSLCFSTSGFLQAIAPGEATPYIVAGCRMLIGAVALFLFSLLAGKKLNLRNWPVKTLFVYSLALWAYQITFFNSLLFVGVAVGTVVSIGVTPIASGIMSTILEKKAPPRAWYPATLLAVIGLILMNSVEGAPLDPFGLALSVFAGICYAVELTIAKPLTEHHTAEESMMVVMFLVGLGLLPFFFFYPVSWVLTAKGLAVTTGLGVITAACAFSLLVKGLKTTPPAIASTLTLAEPMGAALLGIFALGEACSTKTAIGIALIMASILVLVVLQGKQRSESNHP